ncbi:hypothetical protein TSUD_379380 [Trifolium subterraneum]|uniref:Uncharacterized protein n=1 Tax=Trifolium subterraneum TaxID=3900 RepID=A0A2Z6NY24_TRISU|nr:hypothetical protein TSUD_379380 [Trifolium subterraneum]
MEEHPERAELRRIQREQERERRRIRDRQRRQAMTQEQRERHLARRRRNYQLRRQRAANANNVHAPFIPLPINPLALESSAGEASTSDEFQGVNSLTSLDYRVLSHGISFPNHGLNQGQGTMNLGNEVSHEGSSLNMEKLDLKLDNSPRMRLSQIKNLARNQVASAELKTKEDGEVGGTPKSLRLNSVKRIARSQSMNSSPKETASQKDDDLPPEEGTRLLDNQSFMATS